MFNPKIHHRRSIRLKEYDYSQAGLYFVTICTQNREELFGSIENNKMILNDAGEMVDRIYNELINYHNMIIDKYVIMPNHFHGIIGIHVGAESISAQHNRMIYNKNMKLIDNDNKWADMESAPTMNNGLSDIIQTFKRYTTIEYIKMVKQNILPPFKKQIWQRNYYEHIIRNYASFKRITEYILTNPEKWSKINDHEK